MDRIRQAYTRNRKYLCFILAVTFIWGLAAHGYMFFSHSFSHDSLREFNAAVLGNRIKMELGRVYTPLYRDLFRTDLTFPWLIGMLSLLWLSGAVFFTAKTFGLRSRLMIFLTAGILTTNVSVSAMAATYIHDLDCNMFAVMLAAGAVFLWRKHPKGWLLGSVPLAVCLGIYQSYLFTAVTLVMFACILDLLDGESFQKVIRAGLKAAAMVLLGGGLYYVTMKARLHFAGVKLDSNDYQTIDLILRLTPATIPPLVREACRDSLQRLWNAGSGYPPSLVRGLTAVLLAVSLAALLAGLCRREVRWKEKILCAVLAALLPVIMNMTYVLTGGYIHDLMVYAVWLFYLLALLLSGWLREHAHGGRAAERLGAIQHGICLLAAAVLLYGNVQFSNGLYLKKDLEHDAYLSFMTRVAGRMEAQEDYIPGQTPVVFVGIPQETGLMNWAMPGFEEYTEVVGSGSPDVVFMAEMSRYQAYFDYVLGTRIQMPEWEIWQRVNESGFAAEMPPYPAEGCMDFLDGIMVVKFGA